MTTLPDQEWRVEVDLDDEQHGYSLGERLRAHDLDDDARKRIGGGAIVTRDGPRLYVYTTSQAAAGEAERVLRELVEADRLTADIRITVWDEERDAWLDAERGNVVEDPRADEEGPEYLVLVESDDQEALKALAGRLEGRPVELRRGKLLVGVYDDEEVEALADRLRGEAGPDARVQVRADIFDELPSPGFLWFEQRLPGM
ncbi:MAG TPA: hypothetical protein VFX80_10755 [Solirubrobacteraceae bacterium]|nr:hypothetical protein [Solirubrobacteraceae bacterium]